MPDQSRQQPSRRSDEEEEKPSIGTDPVEQPEHGGHKVVAPDEEKVREHEREQRRDKTRK